MSRVYQVAIYGVILLGVVHSALTPSAYPGLTPETLWFAGTGLMLIALGALNAQVRATADRKGAAAAAIVNVLALLLALLASYVIREPQAFLLVLLLGSCFLGSLRAMRARPTGNRVSP